MYHAEYKERNAELAMLDLIEIPCKGLLNQYMRAIIQATRNNLFYMHNVTPQKEIP
ncbi:hypothetical protein KDK_37390 [Dictyobacter kobayashii]|uniref:Uncharacterized protein n=1 Tax=Dictyobacter kobayashii TaxID=2014872 RepID=A0A402ALM6_9CHLR|nr:hypothetical protein KDK_37390 [Dictyobacter kobayashii]